MSRADEVEAVFDDLAARGVEVWLVGGHVRWSAPGGAMTADLLRRLKEHEARVRERLAASRWTAMARGEPPPAREAEHLLGHGRVGLLGLWRENEGLIAESLRRGDQAALAYWRHRRTQVLEPELKRRGMSAPGRPRRPSRGTR